VDEVVDVLTALPAPVPVPLAGNQLGLDVTDTLVAILAAAPERVGLASTSRDRSFVGTTIEFPRLPDGQPYVVQSTVHVPGNRNVRFRARSPRGARLRPLDPAETKQLFVSHGGGRRVHVFEDLVFESAGIALAKDARGQTLVTRCAFHSIPAKRWAVRTLGTGVVGVHVAGCEFSEMEGGGVHVGHADCGDWLIGDGSLFERMGGVGLEIRSPSVHVRDARFEGKLLGAGHRPYIRIAGQPGNRGGLTVVSGCRFGGAAGGGLHGPPSVAVEIDPHGQAAFGVLVHGNAFLGHPGTKASRHSADVAIHLVKAAHACSVTGNHFRRSQYRSGLIRDTSAAAAGANSFHANAVELPPGRGGKRRRRAPRLGEIFAPGGNGGAAWDVAPVTPG